jgi:hypothetical protein
MTSAIKTAATTVLTDSELDTVAGGAADTCKIRSIWDGKCLDDLPPPPPPPPPPPFHFP